MVSSHKLPRPVPTEGWDLAVWQPSELLAKSWRPSGIRACPSGTAYYLHNHEDELNAGLLRLANYVEEKGLVQESNVGELEKIIEKVLKDNTDKVAEYKSGKDKLFGFFVGSVIKESKGKANPALVNDILKKKLS